MSIQSLSYQIVCFYSRTRSFVNCVEKPEKLLAEVGEMRQGFKAIFITYFRYTIVGIMQII